MYQLPDDIVSKGYKEVKPYHYEQVFYSPSFNFEGTEREFITHKIKYKYQTIDKYRRLVLIDNKGDNDDE